MPVRALMISSVMPSLKYSASRSALMLRNGRTAIDASACAAPDTAPEVVVADGSTCNASSANAKSRAFWNLSPASFSRQWATIRAMSGAICTPVGEDIGSSCSTAIMASAALSPRKARRPVSIS